MKRGHVIIKLWFAWRTKVIISCRTIKLSLWEEIDFGQVEGLSAWVFLKMCFCISVIVMLVNVLGVLAENDTVFCEMLGSPEFPLMSKKGDITIGGVFSIHTQISTSLFSLTDKPEPLLCSKYWLFLFLLSVS